MTTRKISLALLTGGVLLALLAQATPSFAILPFYDWRTRSWQRSGVVPVVVAPVAVVPAAIPTFTAPDCNPCATAACSPCATSACSPVTACSPCATTTCASPVVNYVAETAYRVQIVNRPVTTWQSVVTPGACGTCVTSFMPVTTMVAQTQQVPFTTYRPVVSYMPVQCATCPTSPCATGACATGGCATGNCASCASGGVAQVSGTIDEAPSLQASPIPVQPAPQQPVAPQPAPQPQPEQPTGGPSLYPEAQTMTQRPQDTFPSSSPARRAIPAPLQDLKQDGLKPVAPPQLLDPNDKTATLIPMPQQGKIRVVNDGGWRAAQ